MFDFGLQLPAATGLGAGIIAIALGVLVMLFPKIINYVIGVLFLLSGIFLLVGQAWIPGIISLAIGIVIFVFPKILNYLVGVYLILAGIWLIVVFGPFGTIAGIVSLVFGIIVIIFPTVLNYIFGVYLIITGFIVIGRHFGWF
jgi:uncharacterized membrane protein HdeD (DUF308 family)